MRRDALSPDVREGYELQGDTGKKENQGKIEPPDISGSVAGCGGGEGQQGARTHQRSGHPDRHSGDDYD